MDFFTIRQTVKFIRAQGVQDVRQYVIDRANELQTSVEEAIEELKDSALDLWIDRNVPIEEFYHNEYTNS